MKAKSTSLVSAALLVLASVNGVVGHVGLAEAATDDPSLVGLTPSESLTTAPLMTGTLQAADGSPSPGTQVVLYAWPTDDVIAQQVVGDTGNLQPVAYATTSSSGTFALRLSSNSQLSPYAGSDSIANLTAIATDSAGAMTESDTSREVVTTSSGTAPKLMDPAVADASNGSTAAAAPADVVTMRFGAASTASSPAGSTNTAEAGTATTLSGTVAPMQKTCTYQLKATYSPTWVIVGQTYSSTSGASANFQYYSDASTTLGVGVSSSGSSGSFHSSGTVTRNSSAGVDFPTIVGAHSRYHRTQYQYARYRFVCSSPKIGVIYGDYSARPYKYVSGTNEVAVGIIAANYCTRFVSGSHFTADSTKAVNWTNGVDISGLIGIDLSAQTGYGNHARIQETFSDSSALCGVADYPGAGTYRRLVAKD